MVDAAIPSPPTSPNGTFNKRVSFGNDAVKTFIYEKESEEATPILQRQSFTEYASSEAQLQSGHYLWDYLIKKSRSIQGSSPILA
ncbi:hypothetical protein Y032_0293g1610 [Ancylostoma ceylanicum]|uniref:Uncharacterized protein n=1 Tax=Ancylostoma ceylanicum TaxID=53326 RepID=A0A016S4U9_9BILA|nr:hypothetical protein Y032_0293g1610 [Ancylostoma ceylanicum]